MKTQNKVELIGYLGCDPTVFIFPSGKKKVKISLATHSKSKNLNGEMEWVSTWHTIVAWKDKAELALNNFIKGSHILLIGRLVYRNYPDRNGISRWITEIHAYTFTDLDR